MNELLYQKNQAVAALNRVEGFEPLEFARTIKQEDQEDQLYLDVKYRKLWFRLAYPLGRIASTIVRFTENMALAEARIYLNHEDAPENYIANAFSMKFRSEDPKFGDKFLEMAETAAVGRALSDAGFGVQFADVGESNDPAQVDAGIPAPPQYPEAAVGTPSYGGQPVYAGQSDYSGQNSYAGNTPAGNMPYPGRPAETNPSQSMMNQFYRQAQVQGNMMGASVQQMKPTVAAPDIPLDKNLPVEELVNRMTYEQAKAVVIGGKGKFGGKTMGQVAVESPSSLDYFATSYRGHNNLIPAAARVLLNQALPLAG